MFPRSPLPKKKRPPPLGRGFSAPRTRLILEPLEDRTAPALVSWINPLGGSWENPDNWGVAGGHRLPGPADDVEINVAAVITVSASSEMSVKSLTSKENLSVESGTLSIASASQIDADLRVSGGTVQGNGDLAVKGQFLWTGGTLAGSGKLSANAGMTISGAGQKILDGRTLANAGQALVQAGVQGRNGGGFDNLAGGTFEIRTGDNDVLYLADVMFHNRAGATLRRTGSTNSTQVYGYVSNDGLVEVETGTFDFVSQASFGMGRSTSSGQFVAIATNAGRLDLGYMNLASSSSITAKRVNLGDMRLERDYNVTEFTGTGGVVLPAR
jgi:hypothetical protein